MRAAAGAAVLACGLLPATVAGAAPPYGRILEEFGPSVVAVRYTLRPQEVGPGGDGRKLEQVACGVVVDDTGLIVLSGDPFPDPGGDPRNTLEPAAFAIVEPGEVERPATVVGLNRDLNLAYIRLVGGLPEGYRPVSFAPDVRPAIGDEVVVLGLLPERYDFARTYWTGRISAALSAPRTMYALTLFVQDLSIGGLAVSTDGRALGLVAEDVLPPERRAQDLPGNPLALLGSMAQGPRVGYPMLFPPSLFGADLTAPPPLEREPPRSWFGITMQPLSRALGDYWGIDSPGGIIVTSVLEGSPAEAARLRPADVVLEVGSAKVTARENTDLTVFRQMVERLPIGAPVQVILWREGQILSVSLQPEAAPRTGFRALEYEDEAFGLTVQELTLDIIQGQNLPPELQGVVVSELETAGWAMVGGLTVGDIILRVAGTEIDGLDGFRTAMGDVHTRRPPQVPFFVQRGVETLFVTVRTDW